LASWRLAGLARLVPDLAADLVQRVGGGLDDVKRVQADQGVGAALGDRPGDPVGVIAGDELDVGRSARCPAVQERLDRVAIAAGVRPDQATGVVVDDDDHVALALGGGDLVDPDPLEVGQRVAPCALVGHHALADRADRAPVDPHQLRDRLLGGVHGQPRRLVFERHGEARVVPRPRHRGDDHAVLLAADPRRRRVQVDKRGAEVQRPPALVTISPVIAGATSPAVRAAAALAGLRAHPHDQRLLLDEGARDDRSAQPEQLPPYPCGAHVAVAPFAGFLTVRSQNPKSAAACAPSTTAPGAQRPEPHRHTNAAGRRVKRRQLPCTSRLAPLALRRTAAPHRRLTHSRTAKLRAISPQIEPTDRAKEPEKRGIRFMYGEPTSPSSVRMYSSRSTLMVRRIAPPREQASAIGTTRGKRSAKRGSAATRGWDGQRVSVATTTRRISGTTTASAGRARRARGTPS
jgi:hypothetical protein